MSGKFDLRHLAGGLAAWLLSAVLLLPGTALLLHLTKAGSGGIQAAALIVGLLCAVAAGHTASGNDERGRFKRAVFCGGLIAAALLLAHVLCVHHAPGASSALYIIACSMLGAAIGAFIPPRKRSSQGIPPFRLGGYRH